MAIETSASESKRLSNKPGYRWCIFAILAVSYILVYFHRLCPAVVAEDMMADLKASGVLLGLLGSAYFYPYALMQLPAGLLADSWGPRKSITTSFGLAAAGSLMLAWAPSVFWAIFGRTLVGIGVSILFVHTLKVLAEWFSPREFGSMTSLLIAMGGVGSITATSPLAYLSKAVGWRNSFLLVGLVTLVLGVLIWLIVRDRPAESESRLLSSLPEKSKAESSISLGQGIKIVLGCWAFWPLAIWFFFQCAIFFAFTGLWGGPYLAHVYRLDKAQAGHILMMSALGMVIGSPLLSFLSQRVFHSRKLLLIISSAVTVLLCSLLAFMTNRFSIPWLYFLYLAVGFFTNAIVVIGFSATKELFPLQIAGTSTGLANFFPFLGGALLQPFMGYLLEQNGQIGYAFTAKGYQHAFAAMLACSLCALLAAFFVKETL